MTDAFVHPTLGSASSGSITTALSSILAMIALIVSLASLWVSWLRMRIGTRPYVTASVVMAQGGDVSIAYRLQITATGPQPALDIRIKIDENTLERAILSGANPAITDRVKRIFTSDSMIPILAPGDSTRAGFGLTGYNNPTWEYGQVLPVTICYRDLYGRRFEDKINLIVKNASAFAGHDWSDAKDEAE